MPETGLGAAGENVALDADHGTEECVVLELPTCRPVLVHRRHHGVRVSRVGVQDLIGDVVIETRDMIHVQEIMASMDEVGFKTRLLSNSALESGL